MQEPFFIKKIAVLGAGVMGAQIAAHCVNAGFSTHIFDLAPREGGRYDTINAAINALEKIKPAPLGLAENINYLIPCNYDDDIETLSNCDLVIEAIGENLDWKTALYQRIAPYIGNDTIVVSNTSGLSINTLAQILPAAIRPRFCGVHFFNPPRYMQLAELIPQAANDDALLDNLETWITSFLGKNVIRAKDTPNFIANRIGIFSLLVTMHHTKAYGLGFDEVDALTGLLIGRPKSATYRTMDVVGLDTMSHVINTMQKHLQDDPWYKLFSPPDWLQYLIEKGCLGEKTKRGIYRKKNKVIEVFDLERNDYRPAKVDVSSEVRKIMKIDDLAQRMDALRESQDTHAKFLIECYRALFHYCAYHTEAIAYNILDIDLAMRWGFGWQHGPFELWEYSGVKRVKNWINDAIDNGETIANVHLPSWLKGLDNFYIEDGAYSPVTKKYQPRGQLPVYKKQVKISKLVNEVASLQNVVYENQRVCLWHLKDDIAVLGFKSKENIIDEGVVDGIMQAVDIAEQLSQGLIIYQENSTNFSLGADLNGFIKAIDENALYKVEQMLANFQQAVMRLKYCLIPTVAGLRGRALGGGCEIVMHCDATVASYESYPGLVEVAAGLIPAGGGCKELALRAANKGNVNNFIQTINSYFKQIVHAQVATSAPHALKIGYLKSQDKWIMHKDEVLYTAMSQVKAIHAANYVPPINKRFAVTGLDGYSYLKNELDQWLDERLISQHDYFIAERLAYVITGGKVNFGDEVDENYMLKLELAAFMEIINSNKSQERMKHIIATKKRLRN